MDIAYARSRLPVSFLALVVLLGLPLLEAAGRRTAPAAAQSLDSRPSILVIQTDDMRADDLVAMPRLRRLLAAGGVSFENYIVGGTPLCCPSRATVLTGKYPHNTGVTNNSGPEGGHEGFVANGNEAHTIGVALQDAGYRTGFMGKYLNGYPVGQQNERYPPGWDQWHAIIMSSKIGTKGYYYDYRMNVNGTVTTHRSGKRAYSTTLQMRRALTFIQTTPEETPFFLWLNPIAPHKPATPAPGDRRKAVPTRFKTPAFNAKPVGKAPWLARLPKLTKQQRRNLAKLNEKRRRSLLAVDRMVERLATEMPEGSYIFFFSDNGYNLGEFRLPGYKHVPYRSAANVPLVVLGPGLSGEPVSTLASSIDLAPTWADLGGTAMPESDGISLAPLLTSGSLPEREGVLLSWVGFTAPTLQADLDGDSPVRELLASDPGRKRGRRRLKGGQSQGTIEAYLALRNESTLFVAWQGGHRELYDLVEDPYELTNIASTLSTDELARYEAEVVRLGSCEGVTCQ